MKSSEEIIRAGKLCLSVEVQAIQALHDSLSTEFARTVEHLLFGMKGRLVVTGIGKSALIGQKITATLNSTGTPSLFLHAAEAVHGDIGMIQADDVVMCISKSGETPDIKVLLPIIKQIGATLIAMTAQNASTLARSADFLLYTPIEREADPNNLAPTASTTSQLAMGDALAMALLSAKGFSSTDFARFHPGGALGKQLYLRVADLASKHAKPSVVPDTNFKSMIVAMSESRLGAVAVLDTDHNILGIITDGDIRRLVQSRDDFMELKATDIMTKSPKTLNAQALATEALALMKQYAIQQIILIDEQTGQYAGMVHIQDVIG